MDYDPGDPVEILSVLPARYQQQFLAEYDAAATDRVVDLVRAPWDADLMDRGGNTARRQVVFGQGLGLIAFDVDDGAELIRIFYIAWIG
jgi:hypothetical protein